MAFTGLGGREYYAGATPINTSNNPVISHGETNCSGLGQIKGIMTTQDVEYTFHMPNGVTMTITPGGAYQIFPFRPRGVTMDSSTGTGGAFALY